MSLRSTPVSQCLDRRLSVFGFEIPDILAVFLTLSTLNFLFGQTNLKLVLAWLPTLVLALILYFGKKGKPDNYLVHWLRFQIQEGTLSAFEDPKDAPPPPRIDRKGKV